MHINCLLINPVFLPSTLVFGGGFVLVWLFAECTGTCALWTDKMSESEVRERGSEGGTDRDEHGRSWLMHPPVFWAAQPRTLISRPNRMGRAYRSYTEREGWGGGGGSRRRRLWCGFGGEIWKETQKEVSMVINSCSPLSEAVCRWRVGHLVEHWACAGLLTRRRSGPDYHPECSGRSS